ncbi:MAG: hypothetical protein ACYSVY_21650, partial [Planctomycetota bacterium]
MTGPDDERGGVLCVTSGETASPPPADSCGGVAGSRRVLRLRKEKARVVSQRIRWSTHQKLDSIAAWDER